MNKQCPECGLGFSPEGPAERMSSTYDRGEKFYFCSPRCRDVFTGKEVR